MRKFIAISLLLHSFLLFIFLFHIQNRPKVWSGGRGEGVVTLMLEGEGGQRSKGKGQKEGVLDRKSRIADRKERLTNNVPRSAIHPPSSAFGGLWRTGDSRSTPATGQGSSPTPAGGIGGGYDAGVTTTEPNVLQQIRQRILRVKEYPLQARRRGIQGIVELAFQVLPNGNAGKIQVVQSSGAQILDDEAVATIKRGSPYPYYPSEITLSLKFDLNE